MHFKITGIESNRVPVHSTLKLRMIVEFFCLLLISNVRTSSGATASGDPIGFLLTKDTIEWQWFDTLDCDDSTTSSTLVIISSSQLTTLESQFTTLESQFATLESQFTTAIPIKEPFTCPNQNDIGPNCDITMNPCDYMEDLCSGHGTCVYDTNTPEHYLCECFAGYSGENCEVDKRTCKDNTCWHDGNCVEKHQTVSMNNQTKFHCNCVSGYAGPHCELMSDMCLNITCQNRGICRSSYLAWSCQCLGSSLYSGLYCEDKSTSLLIKQVLGKSFASIAIAAIIALFSFVIVMDILKYGFNIDPVSRERQILETERNNSQMAKNKKKKRKAREKIALRFIYMP